MGGPHEHLTVREAVLLVVDAAGVEVGRTSVQKLSYFAALAVDEDLGHKAHYYGPYSRPVESSLVNSALAGDLDETMERFQGRSGPDIRKFSYTLTDQGREEVAQIRAANPALSESIDRVVVGLGESVRGFAQHPLSLAAKVDYIARSQGGTVLAGEVPALARQLDWEMTERDVERAVDILVGLGRVEVPSAS